jgi:hypothetical protein
MSAAPARRTIPYPDPHDVDEAPQLLVVALADAALLAVERALDSAHPILAATKRLDGPPPMLITTEHVAVQILDAAGQLTALLRDYADAVRFDLEDLYDDHLDPF